MKWTNPDALYREITSAEQHRDKRLSGVDQLIGQYHGVAYDSGLGESDRENHAYSYETWLKHQLVFANPRVTVRSKAGAGATDSATAIQHALNRWVRDVNLRSVLLDVVQDHLFCWGVAYVTCGGNPALRFTDVPEAFDPEGEPLSVSEFDPLMPKVERLSFRDWGIDHAAKSVREARYMFHKEVWHKDELKSYAEAHPDEGWNLEAIDALPTMSGAKELGRGSKDVPDREEVVLYFFWDRYGQAPEVPWDSSEEPTPEYGYNGCLHTLAMVPSKSGDDDATSGGFVRETVPFYGPADGPYVLFGAHKVPDEIYPLSPLAAVKSQLDDLNDIDASILENIKEMKNLMIYDVSDVVTAQAIQEGKHGHYLGIPGFNPQQPAVVPMQVGGISPDMLAARNDRRQLLMDVSGFDQQQRGSAGASGTATAAAIADSNADMRTAGLKQTCYDATREVLMRAAYYIHYEQDVVMPIGDEAQAEDIWYRAEGLGGVPLEALELEIEVDSMERVAPDVQQARTMQLHQMMLESMPMMIQFPPPLYDWKAHWDAIGDQLNVPDVGRRFGYEQIEQLAAAMLQMQFEASQSESDAAPRVEGFAGPKLIPNTGGSSQPMPSMPGAMGGMAPGAQGANLDGMGGGGPAT